MAGQTEQQDIENIWRELELGIKDVYAHRAMTTRRFMELYSYVYNFCTNTVTEKGGPGGSRVIRTGKARKKAGNENSSDTKFNTTFVGHDLYNRIKDFLRTYLTVLSKDGEEKMGEDLLTFYQTQWEHYTFSSKVMNGFCAYLNRYGLHWVRRECEEGKEHIYQIYQLCLDMWKDTFFEQLQRNATNTMLNMIERHRNGDIINERLIREVIASYVELGPDGQNENRTNSNLNQNSKLGIYQKKFEEPFLKETENFYVKESALFIQDNSIPDYLRKAELRLLEEEKRIDMYLHASTLPSLKKKVEVILVERQLESIHTEFPVLLKNDQQADLGRLYNLVSRLDNAFGSMKEILEEHIAAEGVVSVLQNGPACLNDPKQYVKTIMSVYNQYHNLVNKSFNSDPGFMAALDKACGKYINSNYVTEAANSSQKSPEILARYCDILLRKTSRNESEDELEEALNESMIVFKYIEDKDVFQKYYSKTLANRLVQQLSASDDAESSMIAKLKQACGFEYTSKLQRMFQDIGLSKEMNDDFKLWIPTQTLPEQMTIDLNVLVLSTGSWPFTAGVEFSLPKEFESSINIFCQYYNLKHTGRKLTWLFNRSTTEVVTNLYSKRYTFVAWTFQAAVMLLYNTHESYTIEELMAATGLKEDVMIQMIQIFLRMKLLETDDLEDQLNGRSIIKLFKDYKNKKQRVSINVPLRYETKIEEDKTKASVEDDRKWECQAAIVRVMKARKALDHQLLMAEVLQLLSNRFKPTVGLIKKCIDILIEKEYLARDADAKDTYNYVA